MKIIGREYEISQLNTFAKSKRAEFVAVYGRRRVGKTFLINEVFRNKLTFSVTGVMNGNKDVQMAAFVDALDSYGYEVSNTPQNWIEAFRELRHFLLERMDKKKRCVIFIDELPCFDTLRSGFVDALGYFWNSWASLQGNLMLIVCGSSTSWMIDNIIDNHGGLYDRITHEIHLRQFTLKETHAYLKSIKFASDKLITLQTYMILGGIPYYLSLLDPALSLAQNIDAMFWGSNPKLRKEYDRLFKILFSTPEPYMQIIELLWKKKSGLTREEIAAGLKASANGTLTKLLENLVNCDLVRFYRIKQSKISSQGGIYQLMDFFVMFYLEFVKGRSNDTHFWIKNASTPTINTWYGLTFEKVCLSHIEQIKSALRLDVVSCEFYSWRSRLATENGRKAQIDIVIERRDGITNICEVKYSQEKYTLEEDEMSKINNRIEAFRTETKTSGGFVPVLITTKGLKTNAYSKNIHWQLSLNDLMS